MRHLSDLLPLPATAYLSSPEEEVVIRNASRRLTIRCAAESGIKVPYEPATIEEGLSASQSYFRGRYGYIDREEVERLHASNLREPDPDPDKLAATARDTLTAAESETVQQCQNDSMQQLGWNKGQVFGLVLDALNESQVRLLKDSRLHTADRAWAACMKQSGYTFERRWGAGSSVTEEDFLPFALQDVECAHETGYLETANAIDVAIQRQLIDTRAAEFQQARVEMDAMLARAKEVVRGG